MHQPSSSVARPTIRADQWFKNITGQSEPEWRGQTAERHIRQAQDGSLEVVNAVDGRTFKAGSFAIYKLGDLVKETEASVDATGPHRKVLFEIITREDRDSIRFVDVAYQQSIPENKNAVFQVASNFNGVEAISDRSSPDSPSFTQDYVYDMTQGPAASISAGAAAITRVHAAFYNPEKPYLTWGQTKKNQVNFLQNLGEHFPVVNGYVCLSGHEPRFPRQDSAEWNSLLLQTEIGYHSKVQVTTGHRAGSILEVVQDSDQIIDQVFCAAMNIGQGSSGMHNAGSPDAASKCKFILQSDYEGTYLSAIKHGRKHIFLTLIGGGVFANRKPWIYEAILNAHTKWAGHPASKIEKVTLVLFSHDDFEPSVINNLKQRNVPFDWVIYRNGQRGMAETGRF